MSRRSSLLLSLGLWTIPAVISAAQGWLLLTAEGRPTGFGRALLVQLAVWWVWAAATPLIAWLLERWPLERGRLAPALPVQVVAAVACAVLHSAVLAWVNRLAWVPPAGEDLRPYTEWFLGYLRSRFQFELLTYVLILLAVMAVRAVRLAREREVVAASLRAQLSEAELTALKMQLQPHFLFNTLHAIGVLIRENPAAAERTVTLLGDLLRATLQSAGVQQVSLAEEVAFLRRYLEIEQVRFQDRLTVRLDIDPEVQDVLVPTLILQPLVENAVRHAIEPSPGAGTIVVTAAAANGSLELAVRDDGPGLGPGSRDGTGLAATRARLRVLYGTGGRLELVPRPEGGLVAKVTLPFRRREAPA